MAIQVSRADADFRDWDGLHALLTRSFAYMKGRIDPPSSLTRMSVETLREKAGEETLLLARDGETLVGCGYLRDDGATLYLGKFAVAQAYRRRGVLRAMFDLAEKIARQEGKTALELQTRIELVENHATFAALGFVKSGEEAHAGYNRPTSIWMRKVL
jgi:GNAT superfamily N-acetyltransferase